MRQENRINKSKIKEQNAKMQKVLYKHVSSWIPA
jgi:hypothetical protein